MHKSIGMLLDGYFPSDIRVEKESKSLLKAGFKVALLCKRRRDENYFDEIDGLQIMRLDAGTSLATKGIFDIVIAVSLIHPVFKKWLPGFIDRFSVDVLHVHDLPLVKTACLVARKHNIKVIADFHENYPEALRVWFQWRKNPLIRLKNRLFFGYKRWQAYEKWAVEHVDHVIAVVDEMRDRLAQQHDLSPEKIVVVTNTESVEFVHSVLDKNIYEEDKDKFIIAYTGGVGPHRGVDTAIEAMNYLKSEGDIVLYITGTASQAALELMNNLVARYSLEDKVKILGFQPFEKFYSYMKMASVNLIPHHSNGHTNNTVPHKLFQCMMVGRPVVVSSSTPLKRIVEETRSGLVFTAGNAQNLAYALLKLHNDNSLRKKLAKNGLQASLEGSHNWETTAKTLIDFYNDVS